MSHHFDSPTGREDPRLNLADFYLFEGEPGTTVMVMAVNPEADPSAAALFRDEGLYAFRFDTDRDSREEVSFKVRFGDADSGGPADHRQSVEVRRAEGAQAAQGADGDLLAEGVTGEVITAGGVRAFTGVVPDHFAADATALHIFQSALGDGKYVPEAFESHQDFFVSRRVAAIVLQVPNELIGAGGVHAWATISLHGHAPETQVARWGLPVITHFWIRDNDMREDFNRAAPAADNERFKAQIAEVVAHASGVAGATADPSAYARQVVGRLGDLTLPYEIGTPAAFGFAGFNGRGLRDNVMDVMLSLTANAPLGNGVAPDPALISAAFPYVLA